MDKRKIIVADIEDNCDTPLAELVHIACQFKSRIMLKTGRKEFNAKSIMGLMVMNLERGMAVEIEAEGGDEAEAALAVEKFLEGRYGKQE